MVASPFRSEIKRAFLTLVYTDGDAEGFDFTAADETGLRVIVDNAVGDGPND